MTAGELPALPFTQTDPLAVPAELAALPPISRVRTPVGDEAWLVTGYRQVRELFADPRLMRSHPEPDRAARITDSALLGAARGRHETELAEHARMRARLTPCFSARRMRALAPRIAEFTDAALDELAARPAGTEVDLHAEFSVPVPVQVICELLGVPYADRTTFRDWITDLGDTTDRERSGAAMGALFGYMGELVARARVEPGPGVISELLTEDGISDEDVAGLAAVLLFAGHETTVTRIDTGVLLLLRNPEQRAALLAEPGRVAAAVEEVLRATASAGTGLPRYAAEDLAVDGVRIAAGEAVLLAVSAANHDGSVYPEPDRFDIARVSDEPHLAFGHGARYCVGAALARIELTTVFARLFHRFPELRLAVRPTEPTRRTGSLGGGFTALPVIW
jgi:cytochrome P450